MVEFPSSAVSTWGGAVVFANVLMTRLGVPIPAVPVLLFAGSAIAAGTLSFWPVLCAAVLGALIGDGVWFTAGRLYGRKLIGVLGRMLPAIDARIEQARALFERFGVPLVSISKFVPGLALVTPPLMGTTAVDARIYAIWDLTGATAWATFWLLGGAAAERQLHMLLEFVRARGGTVIDVLIAAALLYLAYRLGQQRRARRQAALLGSADTATSAAGARQARASRYAGGRKATPKVLDARPQSAAPGAVSPIPGALPLDPHSPEQIDGALRAFDSVIYCVCPDGATAAEISVRMRNYGYTRIRALHGGLEAWQRRGFPVGLLLAKEMPSGKRARSRGDASKTPGTSSASNTVTLRGFAPRSRASA
ncbi:cytochrome P460 [bacterium M00.F.Ca.ET.228.01.1.1]|nr:cytochrome P460 [bacterium M00.F.Ca.ET.228.01.1.1]TGS05405.1 cytochrome P460 [bacterium M00.F.Ca.ET.191.01.1.1]TGU10341.1 cytochrome P460 [bacterium M00.F.Ca.ET.155.01.1.1]